MSEDNYHKHTIEEHVSLADLLSNSVDLYSMTVASFVDSFENRMNRIMGRTRTPSDEKSVDLATEKTEFIGQVHAYHRNSIVPNLSNPISFINRLQLQLRPTLRDRYNKIVNFANSLANES